MHRAGLIHRANTRLSLAVVLLAAALGGCGDSKPSPPPRPGPGAPGAPEQLQRPPRQGEILLEGEASPRRHGPFRFDGPYAVRFAQYAPEAPGRSFGGQVPFVVKLRLASDPRAKPLALFHRATARGSRTLELHGRYLVEVLFGDFPYVVRFTPQG